MKPIYFLILLTAFCSLNLKAQNEPRVVTFKSEESSKDNLNLEQNILKLSVLEYFSGDFALYYERALGDMFGLEMSLGVTVFDYVGSIFDDFLFGYDEKIFQYGLSYSLSLRFYPIDLFDEFYIAPEYKFRRYKWKREYSSGDEEESRKISLPRLNIGYSYFYDNNLLFDYFVGIGLNNETREWYDVNVSQVVTEDLNPRPRFHIGFKIGYAF